MTIYTIAGAIVISAAGGLLATLLHAYWRDKRAIALLTEENAALKANIAALQAEMLQLQEEVRPDEPPTPPEFVERIGAYRDPSAGHMICTRCYHQDPPSPVPMQDTGWGWRCPKCRKVYSDPDRQA